MFYATNRRAETSSTGKVSFGSARAPLSYGTVHVSVPPTHVMGVLERPSWYRLEFAPDPSKHFVMQRITPLSTVAFYNRLLPIAVAGAARSFIFVHGYNVSFEDAALRTAQLSVDLDLSAAPVFYSWPSSGSMTQYVADGQAAEWAGSHLKRFFEDFAQRSGAKRIVVIAHSMGSRPVTRALATLLQEKPSLRARFAEVILAAPDVDEDIFFDDLLPAYNVANKVITLYASSNDKALQLSKKANKARRIGDSSPLPIIAKGVESIDASALDTDFLGHGYVATSRPLMEDMVNLIKNGARPSQRALQQVQTPNGSYWRFRR